MSSTVDASGLDNERGGPSGFGPTPLATAIDSTAQSTQTDTTAVPVVESGSTNFIYIYSFLSTLFVLLCIAILVLLRALVRRRRLDVLFNHEGESNNDGQTAQQQQPQRRQKKRQHLGSKPVMSEAWITSQSTETLLQPFSVTRAPENEKKPVVGEMPISPFFDAVEREPERKSPYPPPRVLSFWQLPSSSSSCTLDNEKVAGGSDTGHTSIGHSQAPISPSFPSTTPIPLDQLRVGFLIAMPSRGIPFEGELPALTVGISTVYAPLDPTLLRVGKEVPPLDHAPERERRRRRRHIHRIPND